MSVPPLSASVSFAIVSYDTRRDTHDPLRFFTTLKPIHFYQHAPYADMAAADLNDAQQFNNPIDLYRKLAHTRPQIVQGGEPFARRLVPVAWAVLAYARAYRRPFIVPALENLHPNSKYGRAWSSAMRTAIRPYVRGAALDIAVNGGAEANLRWAGARPERLVRAMYGAWGVDVAEFEPDGPREELPGTGAKIAFLGRIHREKGVFDLLEALPKVLERVDADLVFIGDGPDRQSLEQAAADARLGEKVHFTGTVMNRDVPRYLRAASVLAAPSRTTQKWAEQVGMSAIQALACGVPVVTTRSGSITEFIEDGVTGLLVPEGDPGALAAALARLLSDPNMRRAFAAAARAQALQRFDARTNIQAIERRILKACGF